MTSSRTRWPALFKGQEPSPLLQRALSHVAYSLTAMTGQEIQVAGQRVVTLPLDRLAPAASDPEAPTIAVYLLLGDDLPGQAVLMLDLADALALVDHLLEAPPGSTAQLGDLERSILSELGNICVSALLNAVAQPEWGPLLPSPPAVMVDMLGIILDAVATSIATNQDALTLVETIFKATMLPHMLRLWVIPDPPRGEYELAQEQQGAHQ